MLNDFAVGRRGEAPSGDCKVGARSGRGSLQNQLHLVGRLPAEHSHRDTVGATQITLHLSLKIIERIEFQVVVEAFLVVSVASLNLSVVPRSPRTNELMLDMVSVAEHIKRMNPLGIEEMGELRAVVGLNDFGSITEKGDGTLDKINRGEAAVFFIRIDESLPRGLLDDRVLVEPLVILSHITDFGNELHIHLPLDAERGGSVVGLIVQGLFLGGFSFLAEAKTNEYAVERAGMT